MGLIKAGFGAIGGTLADQWKDFFVCEGIPADIMVVKGEKRIGGRSSNTHGNDNIISNGSGIVVADGQCMIIVEQGKVVEICAEPGEFTYDTSTEPSIFTGDLKESIKETFAVIGKRFTFGGDTAKDQRVYYFNTKELTDNKFGTPNPVPFKVAIKEIGFVQNLSVRCSGIYSYRIADPLLFYTNVCGNVENTYDREQIDGQLKGEFLSKLQTGLSRLSEMGLSPSELIAHNADLESAMNEALTEQWMNKRGLELVSVALTSVTLPEEDEEIIKRAQQAAFYSNRQMAGGAIAGALQDGIRDAASNENGAIGGFMGMGMAMNSGAGLMDNLFGVQTNVAATVTPANGWTCKCGTVSTGKFCPECGEAKPAEKAEWKCSCGSVNTGKFCPECGQKKPESDKWVCSCGTENEGKFCSECGNKRP